MSRDTVKTYSILVHDRRRPETTSLVAELAHDARAIDFARERLDSSAHYQAIEVWREGVKLFEARNARQVA